MLIDRRDFVVLMTLASAARALYPRAAPPGPDIDVLVDDRDANLRRGVELSVDEAQRAAQLFGGSVTLNARRSGAISLLIGGATPGSASLQMNVTDRTESAREACRRNVFHVVPSSELLAWSGELKRFGADSLNKRFRERFRSEMDTAAWCGWFAVKCVWEAALRSRAPEASTVIAFIERSDTRFDGHKGAPLYFDGAHQLIQPLYGGPSDQMQTTFRPCDWK